MYHELTKSQVERRETTIQRIRTKIGHDQYAPGQEDKARATIGRIKDSLAMVWHARRMYHEGRRLEGMGY